jgi:hypothetical protein
MMMKEIGIGDMAVLTFELSGIQHAIKKAVLARAEGLNELIDQEVQKAFTEDKIIEAIRSQVEAEFQRSMQWGEGAQIIRKFAEEQVRKAVAKLVGPAHD